MTPQELQQLANNFIEQYYPNDDKESYEHLKARGTYEAGFRKALELLLAVQDDLGISLANTPDQLLGYL